eukprot:1879724-Ditylum_brightwellii.AAC.1
MTHLQEESEGGEGEHTLERHDSLAILQNATIDDDKMSGVDESAEAVVTDEESMHDADGVFLLEEKDSVSPNSSFLDFPSNLERATAAAAAAMGHHTIDDEDFLNDAEHNGEMEDIHIKKKNIKEESFKDEGDQLTPLTSKSTATFHPEYLFCGECADENAPSAPPPPPVKTFKQKKKRGTRLLNIRNKRKHH